MEENKRHLELLRQLLQRPDNRECADCVGGGTAARPSWASINTGTFICMRCAGIHRGLGVHISKVCAAADLPLSVGSYVAAQLSEVPSICMIAQVGCFQWAWGAHLKGDRGQFSEAHGTCRAAQGCWMSTLPDRLGLPSEGQPAGQNAGTSGMLCMGSAKTFIGVRCVVVYHRLGVPISQLAIFAHLHVLQEQAGCQLLLCS